MHQSLFVDLVKYICVFQGVISLYVGQGIIYLYVSGIISPYVGQGIIYLYVSGIISPYVGQGIIYLYVSGCHISICVRVSYLYVCQGIIPLSGYQS